MFIFEFKIIYIYYLVTAKAGLFFNLNDKFNHRGCI
jgi:hypothetical protein